MAQDDNKANEDIKSKTLGIVPGTGNMGSSFCRKYAELGFKVLIGSRSKDKAEQTKKDIETAVGKELPNLIATDNEGACKDGDIIFWAISGSDLAKRHEALASVAKHLSGKTVIDLTNIIYTYPKEEQEKIWGQESAVLQNKAVCDKLGIKDINWTQGFKSLFADLFKAYVENKDDTPIPHKGNPYQVLVCGDSDKGKKETMALVEAMEGFKAVDCGPLVYSKIVELLGPNYIFRMVEYNNDKKHIGSWGWNTATCKPKE